MGDDEDQEHRLKQRRIQNIAKQILNIGIPDAVHVSEIYSPPRVTEMAREMGMRSGFAIDKKCGWDLDDDHMIKEMFIRLEVERPHCVVGSPECTPFSRLQNLNKNHRDPNEIENEINYGRKHLAIACSVYEHQYNHGRFFCMSTLKPLQHGMSIVCSV